MRCRSLVLFAVLAFLVACGGGSGGDDDGNNTPDAAPVADAAPDAPAAVTGLGKRCVLAMQGADCPETAPGCLGPFVQGGTMGICTNLCVQNGTFRTDGNSQPTNLMPADLTSQNATCAGLYMGPAVGTPACNIVFNRMPTGALMPNTNYTFQMACGIGCSDTNTCPGDLTCNATSKLCEAL